MTAISANNAAFDQALFMAQNHKLSSHTKLQKPAGTKLDDKSLEKINATAQEFEAVFLSEMMSHIFNNLETNEMFGGGKGEEMYKSMMVREYGNQMATKGGIGLAKHISAQMIKLQEMQQSQ